VIRETVTLQSGFADAGASSAGFFDVVAAASAGLVDVVAAASSGCVFFSAVCFFFGFLEEPALLSVE
jgi:hypothetical protein